MLAFANAAQKARAYPVMTIQEQESRLIEYLLAGFDQLHPIARSICTIKYDADIG